jgi:2-keto-4-pentenoate hydratase
MLVTLRSRIAGCAMRLRFAGTIGLVAALAGLAVPVNAMARRPVDPAENYAREVIEANDANRRLLPISTAAPAATLPDSYRVSREIVRSREKRGDRIVGFKGGLARPGQQIEGRPVEPIVGVLFDRGLTPVGGSVGLGNYRTLVVEAELAFTFKQGIRLPVTDVAALKAAVASIRPAIELPDISLDGPVRSPQDLAAINIGSAKFILGPEFPQDHPSMARLAPTILREGQEIARGTAADAIGDPWQLLQKLVNTVIANGYEIKPGHSILAGAIAAVPNAPPGEYLADFGTMGRIPFTIAPALPTRGN